MKNAAKLKAKVHTADTGTAVDMDITGNTMGKDTPDIMEDAVVAMVDVVVDATAPAGVIVTVDVVTREALGESSPLKKKRKRN